MYFNSLDLLPYSNAGWEIPELNEVLGLGKSSNYGPENSFRHASDISGP
jgi:hypothetical protein